MEALKREGELLESLRHPNIISFREIIEEGATLAVVHEYAPGRSLAESVLRERATIGEALRMLEALLEALASAHELGLVHGDLNPSGVLIYPNSKIRIADFGIARLLSRGQTVPETPFLGTLAYTAPERFHGEVTLSADLYALGLLVFEMLSGRRACPETEQDRCRAWHEGAGVSAIRAIRPDAPPWLDVLLAKTAARRSEDRPWSAEIALELFRTLRRRSSGPLVSLALPHSPAPDDDIDESEVTDPGLVERPGAGLEPGQSLDEVTDPGGLQPAPSSPVVGGMPDLVASASLEPAVEQEPDPEPCTHESPEASPLTAAIRVEAAPSAAPAKVPPTKPGKTGRSWFVWAVFVLAFLLLAGGGLAIRLLISESIPPGARPQGTAGESTETPRIVTVEPLMNPSETVVAAPSPLAAVPSGATGAQPIVEELAEGGASLKTEEATSSKAQPGATPASDARASGRQTLRASAPSPTAPRAPVRGSIAFDSKPSGAEVFVDGRRAGQTPLESIALDPGDHRISVRKEGYQSREYNITIVAGRESYWAPVVLSPASP